jgi:putative thymidine phosphorylase
MVAIPIIASLGLTIPKTSSRAITSPAGTADTMEVLAPVTFDGDEVRRIVKKTGGCLIWGGGLSIAPADDIIIRVSKPLSLEPYDKMIVSIMAKKVAMGIRYLVIDMPYGLGTKIQNLQVGRGLEQKFKQVGKAFGIKLHVRFQQAHEPIGQGIGPALEARDVLRVLQQQPDRPRDLERKAIQLSAELLALSGVTSESNGRKIALQALQHKGAWKKMQQIIDAQGGNPHIDGDQLVSEAVTRTFGAPRTGWVKGINNRAVDEVARTLGAPEHKLSGIYLHKKIGQRVRAGEPLFTFYSYTPDRLHLAAQALQHNAVMDVGLKL